MSYIGQNIKKIRGVKNLSQSDFAKKFDLKRASIGAYEEGRAEPKISTIIEIANYFSISMDDLLRKELKVNDLYRFDIFRKDLLREEVHNLNPTIIPEDIIAIPFVSLADRADILKKPEDIKRMPSLNIPLKKGAIYIAVEWGDNSMANSFAGILSGDIIICRKLADDDKNSLELNKLYLFVSEKELHLRKLLGKSLNEYTLGTLNPDFYNDTLRIRDVRQVWQIETLITKKIGNQNLLTDRISEMEKQLKEIIRKQK